MSINAPQESTSNTKIIRPVIYLRVSTNEQDYKSQLVSIRKFCSDNKLDFDSIPIYQDKESASKALKNTPFSYEDDTLFSTRTDLNRLLLDANLHKFDTLILHSHDRLTRNVYESFMLKLMFQKLGTKICYTNPGENLNSKNEAMNTFFDNLLSNLSEFESNLIASRTKLGNSYNIKQGYWAGGKAPLGYRLKRSAFNNRKSHLTTAPSDLIIVKDIFALYAQGESINTIATLMSQKYPDKRKWTGNSIKSILNNETYTGTICWDRKGGKRNPVKHKSTPIRSPFYEDLAIITCDEFDKVKELRQLKKANPKYLNSPYILRDKLCCGICNKRLRAKNNGINKKSVYHCENYDEQKGKNRRHISVPTDVIHESVKKKLIEFALGSYPITFIDCICDNLCSLYNKELLQIAAAISEIESQLGDITDYISLCSNELNVVNNKESLFECEKETENKKEADDKFKEKTIFLNILDEANTILMLTSESLEKQKKTLTDRKGSIENILQNRDLMKTNVQCDIEKIDNFINSPNKDSQLHFRQLVYCIVEKIILTRNSEKGIDIDIIFK